MDDGQRDSRSDDSAQVRVAIVDYGMGNVRSVQGALERLGYMAPISADPHVLASARSLILPGVGAFGKAIENLQTSRLVDVLHREVCERGKPILGVCLGMQLFADSSDEHGVHQGLGWIPGHVTQIDVADAGLSLPHVGWNQLATSRASWPFAGLRGNEHFYFDHSFCYRCDDEYVASTVGYGGSVVAAVRRGNVVGVQFHPEKSQTAGLKLLRGFVEGHGLGDGEDGSTGRRAETAC